MNPPADRILTGIQALRAVAAIAVVAYHASARAGEAWMIGQAGVDIFFVVSGFVMWGVRERGVTPGGFLRDRILRITPLYWLATLAMIASVLFGLSPHVRLTLEHIAASFFYVPVPSPTDGQIWPLLVQGWTLNYEMFFYALFTLVLCAPRAWHLPLLLLAFIALPIAGLFTPDGAVAFAFYADPIVLEFAAGVAIAALWNRGLSPGSVMAWSLIVAGFAAFAVQTMVPIAGERVLIYGLPAMAIVAGVAGLERKPAPSWPLLRFLGDASYSIYLFHTFAIALVARFLGDIFPPLAGTMVGALAGVALGWVVFVLVERPLMRFFKRRRLGDTSPPVAQSVAP